MQSQSFGNKRRISRKAGQENMSAQAESCELRTLLCASVTGAGVMVNLDLPMDGHDFEITSAIEPGIDEAVKFVVDDSVSPGTGEGPVDGPVDWPVDGPVDSPVDGSVDSPVDSEEMWLQPMDWDPSWIYQTLNIENEPMSDTASDEAVATDGSYSGYYDGSDNGYYDDYYDGSYNGYYDGSYNGYYDGYYDGSYNGYYDEYTETLSWDSSPGDSLDGQVDGPTGEEVPTDKEVFLDDAAPMDDLDPEWAYRTFDTLADESLDGSVPFGDQPADGEKLTEGESVVFEDTPPVEGWDHSWDYHTLEFSLGDDEVLYLDATDPQLLDEVSGELVEVVIDGETTDGEPPVVDPSGQEPKSAPEWSDTDPFLIYFSAAAIGDGVEVQRGHDSSSVSEDAVGTSALMIPVRQSSSIPLFNTSRDRSSLGIPADVQSNSALADSAIPAKRNAGQRRSSTQVRTATQAGAVSEGLINLKPLLGEDAESSDNDAHESTVDPQAVESGSIEETVSAHGDPLNVASGFATNKTVPPRSGRAAMIDRVMAQYAENSFNS